MRRSVLILTLALTLVACASTAADDPISDDDPPPSAGGGTSVDGVLVIEEGSTATGPGIGVTEALEYTGTEAVLVNGALFVDADGGVLLCEAIAESFPPQCGGTRLEVRGLDPAGQLLEEADGVRWAESVQLLGRVQPAN